VAASAWYFAFTMFSELGFTLESLSAALGSYASKQFPNSRIAASAFHKDAACIARMYVETRSAGNLSEETIQSPFAELGLLSEVADADLRRVKSYRFEIGQKIDLPPEIVAATCIEFADRVAPAAKTIALPRLLSEPGSPGMAFKLGESALYGYLEDASRLDLGVVVGDAAGLIQFAFVEDPTVLTSKLIDHYYSQTRQAAFL